MNDHTSDIPQQEPHDSTGNPVASKKSKRKKTIAVVLVVIVLVTVGVVLAVTLNTHPDVVGSYKGDDGREIILAKDGPCPLLGQWKQNHDRGLQVAAKGTPHVQGRGKQPTGWIWYGLGQAVGRTQQALVTRWYIRIWRRNVSDSCQKRDSHRGRICAFGYFSSDVRRMGRWE
jgi:hypothetical protein